MNGTVMWWSESVAMASRRWVRAWALCAGLGLTTGAVAGGVLCAPAVAEAQDGDASERDPARRAEIVTRYKSLLEKNPSEFLFKQLFREVGYGQQLEKLIEEYRDKSAASPDVVNYRLIHGRLLMAARRFPEAVTVYDGAVKAAPRNAKAWLGYGVALQQAKRPEESQAAFEKALDLERNKDAKMDILRDLADLAFARQDWDAAKTYYDRMIKLETDGEYVREEYARRLMEVKRYDDALAQYQTILRGAGRNVKTKAEAMKHIGEVYAAMKRYDDALAIWRQANGLVSGDSYLRQEIEQLVIDVYRDKNDLPGLIAEYERRSPNPSYEQAMVIAGLYDEIGREEEAMAFYKKALGKNRGSVDARLKIIHLLERRGATDEVLKAYEDLVRAEPGQSSYQFELAERYWRKGDKRKAVSAAQKLARSFKDDAVVQSNLADLYMRWDMRDEVLKQYQAMVRLAPNDPTNLIGLGEFYWQEGKREKALETWRRIMKLGIAKADAHATLGQVYADHNMTREAIVELQKALKLSPKDEKLHRSLALVYERGRDLTRAIEAWEGLLALTRRQHFKREARSRIIQIHHRRNQLRAKLADYRRRFDADEREAGYFLGESYIVLREYGQAEKVFEQMLEGDAEDMEALLALNKVYAETSDYEKNIGVLRRMAKLSPERARDYYHRIAELSLKLYDDDQAVEFASLAVDLNPGDANAHARLGRIYAQMQDLTRASAQYRTALQLDPMAYRYYFELAEIYLALDKVREADALYRELMSRSRDETEVLRAGRRSIAINDALEALDTLEQALTPLVAANPTRKVYGRLQLELYDRMTRTLIAAADYGPPEVRRESQEALREISKRALGPLLGALADEDLSMRMMAIQILGDLRNPNAAVPLARLLDTKDQDIRVRAALAAGKLGDPKAVAPMLRAVNDSNTTVRQIAVWALGRMGAKEAAAPLRRVLETDPEVSMRVLAALSLGRIGAEDAVTLLTERLASPTQQDAQASVRVAAAWALGSLGKVEALTALKQVIAEAREPEVRRMAAWALGNIGDPKALEALLDAYWSSDPEVREVAGKALLRLGPDDADGRAPYVIWEENLGFFDPESGVIDVNFMLNTLLSEELFARGGDGSYAILQGEAAIASLLQREMARADDQQIGVILYDLDQGPDGLLGLGALTWFMPEEDARRKKVEAALGRIGAAISERLRTLLSDDTPTVRAHAAGVIGRIRDKAAVDNLIAAIGDEDQDVRAHAAEALGFIADARALSPLSQRLGADDAFLVRSQAARALGRLGDAAAVAPLSKALDDAFPWVQVSAAEALGDLGEASAVDALTSHLDAATPPVRVAILQALRAIGGAKAERALESWCQKPDPALRAAAGCREGGR